MTSAADQLATTGFGVENLPYGSYSVDGGEPVLGVRLGDVAIELAKLAESVPGLSAEGKAAVSHHNLDKLLAAGHTVWKPVREWIIETVSSEEHAEAVKAAAVDVAKLTYHLAFTPADYVDFYASEHHATNIGKMWRPDQEALKPNWKHLPVGYHGRSGTVIVSGTNFARPKGLRPFEEHNPSFGPCERLDIECELGFVLGGHAPQGEVSVQKAAEEFLFGAYLFNDWSARDIQSYEYVPLGPNLGKSFASSVGAWIVPWDALRPAFVDAPERTYELAEYLHDGPEQGGPYGLDIDMEVEVDGDVVSHPPYGLMYYTAPQMVAHMSVNGGSIRPGDMFGSGTVSGPEKNQRGSFMELSWGATEPLQLSNGTEMTWLQDGQTVTLRGTASLPGGAVIDFGECVGTVLPATE